MENARIQRLASKVDELENAAPANPGSSGHHIAEVWTTAEPEQHSFQAQERRLFLKELTLAFCLPERTAEAVQLLELKWSPQLRGPFMEVRRLRFRV